MAVERYENEMDGESVIVPASASASEIPKDFRSLLSPEDEAAFAHPEIFFRRLAERAVLPEFREWLAMLAAAGLKKMELHKSGYVESAVLFRFELANGMSPAIALPRTKPVVSLPGELRSVFEIIGGTIHGDWEMAGGLLTPKMILSVADFGVWLNDTPAEDPARCFAFYSTASGDLMCFQPAGTAVWYEHEAGDFVKFGSVREFLSAYFLALSAGREFDPGL